MIGNAYHKDSAYHKESINRTYYFDLTSGEHINDLSQPIK